MENQPRHKELNTLIVLTERNYYKNSRHLHHLEFSSSIKVVAKRLEMYYKEKNDMFSKSQYNWLTVIRESKMNKY